MPAEWSSPIDFRIRQPDFGTLRERWLEKKERYALTSVKQERLDCNELFGIDS
jgi:hypothetical protein